MRIYIDFDDVICETGLFFSHFVDELYNVKCPYQNMKYFNLQQSFELTDEQYENMMRLAHGEKYILSYEETDSACSTIGKWIQKGYDVNIVTGRPFYTAKASRTWLEQHGLSDIPIIHVDKYKRDAFYHNASESTDGSIQTKNDIAGKNPDFLNELQKRAILVDEFAKLKFDFAVEDSPAALEHLTLLKDCTVAVFDRPWNKNTSLPSEKFIRCAGWNEIDKLLEKITVKTASPAEI